GGADHDLLADDAIVDAQPACLVFVDGHRSRTGIDEQLHRLPVDRAGDPVVAALPLGDAQLLALRLGIPRAQFATEVVVALDTFDAQYRTLAIGADHLNASRPGLPHPYQLALAINIQYGGAGKKAHHLQPWGSGSMSGNQQ